MELYTQIYWLRLIKLFKTIQWKIFTDSSAWFCKARNIRVSQVSAVKKIRYDRSALISLFLIFYYVYLVFSHISPQKTRSGASHGRLSECVLYRCVSLILYLCNFFISHYIPLVCSHFCCTISNVENTYNYRWNKSNSQCSTYQWRQLLKISHNRNSVVKWTCPKYIGVCGSALKLFTLCLDLYKNYITENLLQNFNEQYCNKLYTTNNRCYIF